MKFSQVPVGSRFELDGEAYVKSGPMVATHEATGKQRFIGRYAEVAIPGAAAPAAPASSPAAPDTQSVDAAFAVFYDRCLRIIAQLETSLDPQTVAAARAELEAARAQFAATLARSKPRS